MMKKQHTVGSNKLFMFLCYFPRTEHILVYDVKLLLLGQSCFIRICILCSNPASYVSVHAFVPELIMLQRVDLGYINISSPLLVKDHI